MRCKRTSITHIWLLYNTIIGTNIIITIFILSLPSRTYIHTTPTPLHTHTHTSTQSLSPSLPPPPTTHIHSHTHTRAHTHWQFPNIVLRCGNNLISVLSSRGEATTGCWIRRSIAGKVTCHIRPGVESQGLPGRRASAAYRSNVVRQRHD